MTIETDPNKYTYYPETTETSNYDNIRDYFYSNPYEETLSPRNYQEGIFDCSEMSAYYEQQLESAGFDVQIQMSEEYGHAWLYLPKEDTVIETTKLDSWYFNENEVIIDGNNSTRMTYNESWTKEDYLKNAEHTFDNIEEAQAWDNDQPFWYSDQYDWQNVVQEHTFFRDATPVATDTEVTHELGTDDTDMLKFHPSDELANDEKGTLEVKSTSSGLIELYKDGSNDDKIHVESNHDRIVVDNPDNTDYYAAVNGSNEFYTFETNEIVPSSNEEVLAFSNEEDVPDSMSNAMKLDLPINGQNEIGGTDWADYFQFSPDKSREVNIKMESLENKDNFVPDLGLFSEDYSTYESTFGTDSPEQEITTQVDADSTYYMYVFASNADSDTPYELEITGTETGDTQITDALV